MVTLTLDEIWKLQSLQDDFHRTSTKFSTYYGKGIIPEYFLRDMEYLLIVEVENPQVELHVMFSNEHYLEQWTTHVKEKYQC